MNKVLMMLGMVVGVSALAGCNSAMRPQLTPVGQNLTPGGAQLVAAPISVPAPLKPAAGSLWVPGSRQFFKDSRARDVGDIITILVSEETSAQTQAKTDATRTHNQSAGITSLLNAGSLLTNRGIPLTANGLFGTTSDRDFAGDGKTDRRDSLNASVAAVVKQVLPNGLLVVQGQREVMVNYEKQIMQIAGIVRPEDISAQNTIPSSRIAEARIGYTGQGLVDEAQAPQYGAQLINKLFPF